MTTILHLNTSIFGEQGASSQLSQTLIHALSDIHQDSVVVSRDASSGKIPHITGETLAAVNNGETSFGDSLIAEVQEADIIVLAVPMYNFGIPSELKAWFDHIARAQVTFKYTENGPVGLLENKKVYVVTTRGGLHRDKSSDHQVPFLNTMLGFLGLTDIDFIYAEGLAMGDNGREKGIAQAEQTIQQLLQTVKQQEALS